TDYHSFTASLRLKRANLHRLDGDRAAATDDVMKAIVILSEEEKAALNPTAPQPDQTERLWSSFFGRSQEAYRALIRLRVADGAGGEAFKYAERSRAYEPLHLVLKRNDLPPEFINRIHDDEPLGIEDLEEIVPAGTFLL